MQLSTGVLAAGAVAAAGASAYATWKGTASWDLPVPDLPGPGSIEDAIGAMPFVLPTALLGAGLAQGSANLLKQPSIAARAGGVVLALGAGAALGATVGLLPTIHRGQYGRGTGT